MGANIKSTPTMLIRLFRGCVNTTFSFLIISCRVQSSPFSIADIDDNYNFHQLCFSTSDKIVKISMMANTVEDPNHDPNLYSEIDVSFCTP